MPRDYLVGTFANPDALVQAVTEIREQGFKIYDVYTPCPVHGLAEAMGLHRSRLPYVTLVAGIVGLLTAIGFQFYAAVFDWPLNVGGKPDNSTLAFVPIAFELTVLAAGLATAGAFLLRSGLISRPGARIVDPRVTDDRFAIVLRWRSSAFDTREVQGIMLACGAIGIRQAVMDL